MTWRIATTTLEAAQQALIEAYHHVTPALLAAELQHVVDRAVVQEHAAAAEYLRYLAGASDTARAGADAALDSIREGATDWLLKPRVIGPLDA